MTDTVPIVHNVPSETLMVYILHDRHTDEFTTLAGSWGFYVPCLNEVITLDHREPFSFYRVMNIVRYIRLNEIRIYVSSHHNPGDTMYYAARRYAIERSMREGG